MGLLVLARGWAASYEPEWRGESARAVCAKTVIFLTGKKRGALGSVRMLGAMAMNAICY